MTDFAPAPPKINGAFRQTLREQAKRAWQKVFYADCPPDRVSRQRRRWLKRHV